MNYIGNFAEDSAVSFLFSTSDASGGAIAPSDAFEADDFIIYKNYNQTQKATTNGITVLSPFDSVTGLHCIIIDTSNDTGDVGFWDKSNDYTIVLSPDTETVDGQTVVVPIGRFSIENRVVGSGVVSANVTQISGDATAANNLEALLDGTGGVTLSGDLSGSVGSISGITFPTNFSDLAITATTGQVDVNSLSSTAETQVATQTAVGMAVIDPVTKTYYDAGQASQLSSIQSEFTTIKGATWSSSTDTLEAIRDASGGGSASNPQVLQTTTIATLASQTSFTLTAGSSDDDAYNDMMVVVTDSATSTQKAVGFVSDYVGSTKTVTLKSDPAVFTMAVGDSVDIIAVGADMPTIAGRFDTVDTNIGTPVDGSLADDIYNTDQRVFTVKNDTTLALSRIGTPASDLATELAAVDTVVDGIKAVTDNLPDSGALTTLASNLSAVLADTGTDGVVISTATAQAIADEILSRNVSNVESSAAEHTLTTIVLAILESARSSTTWTIKRTDGSTTHATKTLTLDASASPVIGVD